MANFWNLCSNWGSKCTDMGLAIGKCIWDPVLRILIIIELWCTCLKMCPKEILNYRLKAFLPFKFVLWALKLFIFKENGCTWKGAWQMITLIGKTAMGIIVSFLQDLLLWELRAFSLWLACQRSWHRKGLISN